MPGKVDAKLWDRAKAAAMKQYPDLGERNPRLWMAVSAIYKSAGGELSEKMEKSLVALEANLAKLDGKSSMLDTPIESTIAKSIAGQFDGHAEAPGDLEKAAGVHRYTSRIPLPGGGYRYVYPEGQGPGQRPAAPGATKKPAPPIKKTPGSNKPGMKDAVERVNKKDAAASKADLKRKEAEEEAKKKKKVEKAVDAEFEAFSKTYRDDIKKSLAESHPDWDAETLERRVEPQVRQMFRLHGG